MPRKRALTLEHERKRRRATSRNEQQSYTEVAISNMLTNAVNEEEELFIDQVDTMQVMNEDRETRGRQRRPCNTYRIGRKYPM